MCKVVSNTATPPNKLPRLTTQKPKIRPCRSCWKTLGDSHSLHLCLKQKRQERQREEDRKINLHQFLTKNTLTPRSIATKKEIDSSINLTEAFINKYCTVWKLPEPVQPIKDLPRSPFKTPLIPTEKSKLPFKKQFLPIDYSRWYGYPRPNQTKSQNSTKRHN